MTLMDIATATISSKGQIVIPKEFRKAFEKGDKVVIVNAGDTLIIKRASIVGKQFEEDMKFAKSVELAWKEVERGEYYEADSKAFVKEFKKW